MSKDKSNKGWFGRHKVLTIVGVIVVLIIIGSVAASNNKTTVNTTASTSSSSSSSNKSTSSSSSPTAHVGSTVDVGGSKGLAVTLNQVIDPASGADQYTSPNAGDRFVAIDVKIVNNGTAAFSDDANSDVTLIGTDNQSYTADFDSVSECTNFNSGQYTLAPGESTTGCVVFQVPDAVNTGKVQFQTQSGLSQSTGEWLVP
jgi:cytoskeletal protein RodZ